MADGTKIEWTDATLNVVSGCSVCSPGCANCYAMRAGGRNLPGHPSTGLTQPSKAGHVWTGEVRFDEDKLQLPLRWRRPRRIFWNAHGDLFHDTVPDEWIDRCFAAMAQTSFHQHQVLTKRSARMREYFAELLRSSRWLLWKSPFSGQGLFDPGVVSSPFPLPNVWLGVSVEDQARADERIPDLLATPAAVRWLSCEPLLGPVDLTSIDVPVGGELNALSGVWRSWPIVERGGATLLAMHNDRPGLDWVVVGGESGKGARPMHPDWARSLRDQCAAAGVPFLFKQWGDWAPFDEHEGRRSNQMLACDGSVLERVGKRRAGRLLDGAQHDGFPA